MERFKCAMCFFRGFSTSHLEKHIVRCHRFDSLFKVTCWYDECGATFRKWKSYKQHKSRRHSQVAEQVLGENNIPNSVDDQVPQQVLGENYVPNNVPVNNAPDNIQNNVDDQVAQQVLVENNVPNNIPATNSPNNIQNNVEDEEHDLNLAHIRDRIIESEEEMNWKAAQFLIDIRETCKTSHVALEKISEGVVELIGVYSSNVLNQIQELKNPVTNSINVNTVKRLFTDAYAPSKLFESVHSKWYLDKVLTEKFKMVSAKPLKLGTTLVWKKKKGQRIPRLIEIKEMAYVVPFLKNLENLLLNAEVRNNINDFNQSEDGVLRTVLNGTYYRENEFFSGTEKALAIILYYDELGIANPLGSHSKDEKLCMFYWTLGNLDPRIRCSQNGVQLLAIVKSKLFKKYGLKKILNPFIEDIKKLRTEGITVTINEEEKNYKGSVLFCAGDTPASALLGGFKESVAANRPCRSCLALREEIKENFRENFFVNRKLETHELHLEVITDPNLSKGSRKFWKRRYGVNSRSPLSEILDVTECLPQDVMHLFSEGVTEICTRALLHYYIVEKNLFTLEELNERMRNFCFNHFKTNKPSLIEKEQLAQNSNLKQSASEMLGFAHSLPFLINEWILEEAEDDILERILCHVRLLQIINVCSAYEIHVDTTFVLNRMIELFILEFNRLYPEWIVPKFHFIQHLPRYIRMFGPSRQQWCFRFEQTHQFFKDLVPVIRNFKNPPLSFCYRYQARLASKLANYPGSPPKKFLDQGDDISYGEKILLRNLPHEHLLTDFIGDRDPETCSVLRCLKLKTYGTTYESGSILLLDCNEDSLPSFGVLKEMFMIDNVAFFIYINLETLRYAETLNAYQVRKSLDMAHHVISLKDIIFPHPIPQFECENNKFVLLLDHERTEFYG